MTEIPKESIREANDILASGEEGVSRKMASIKGKIGSNPKFTPLMAKWSSIVTYMLSKKVPVKNKAKILGGLLYIVLPDFIPGPVDDILVGTFLLPYVGKELDRFLSGAYDTPESHAHPPVITIENRNNRFFFEDLC